MRWLTWDEPDRQIAVAHWTERDVAVVFPLQWARRGQRAMIARAKERILEVEGARTLAPGSVLLAFSRHRPPSPQTTFDPDVPHGLLGVT